MSLYETTVILQYINCRPESLSHINLTSTSHQQDDDISQAIAEKMSNSGLNPHNPSYKEIYAKFTSGEASISDSKYILICEDNRYGISNFPKSAHNQNKEMLYAKEGHSVAFLYESIFENGDNMLWGKYNYVYFQKGKPSLQPGIMKEVTSGEFTESFHLDSYFRAYLLNDHPHFKHGSESYIYTYSNDTEVLHPFSETYGGYLLFLRNAVIADVKKGFAQLLNCEVNGANFVFIDASSDASQTQDIKNMCSWLGGKIPSLVEAIQEVCSMANREQVSFGNEAFNITCDNFQTVLHELVERTYTYDEL